MNDILSILQRELDKHPDSRSLQVTISHLSQVGTNGTHPRHTWDVLEHDFNRLIEEGLWDRTPENNKLVEDLRQRVIGHGTDNSRASNAEPHTGLSSSHAAGETSPPQIEEGKGISIVLPPPISTPLLDVSSVDMTALPIELAEALNQAYFLHLLATDPERVLPPGKSLLSVMLQPRAPTRHQEGKPPSLQAQVEDAVHRAFWDEVRRLLVLPCTTVL